MIGFKQFFDAFSLINSIIVPAGNMGISRAQMPQIKGQYQAEFISWLGNQGITVKKSSCPVGALKLVQNEFSKPKVWKFMQQWRETEGKNWPPVVISNDGFVVDGSHRFIAIYNLNRYASINVIQISMSAKDLILLCRNFPRVEYRNHSDAKI